MYGGRLDVRLRGNIVGKYFPSAFKTTRSSATADGPGDLVSCCTTVGTSCTTNPQPIEVMELEHFSARTCNELYLAAWRSG